jgi:hypothetical protein
MPRKMAGSDPRPPFGLLEVTVAVRTSRLSCRKAERREYFRQFRSHLENPDLRRGFPCGLAANQDARA